MRYSYKRLCINVFIILTILITGTLGGTQVLLKDGHPRTALADDPPTTTPTPEPPPIDPPPPTDGAEGVITTDPAVTTEPAPVDDGAGGIQAQQTYCQLDINNSNDSNPYTYTFTALYSGIAAFTWGFGDGFTATGAGPHTITYLATGTKNITLNCDALPQLTGSISITTSPVAGFNLSPSNYTGLLPVTVQTVNTSTPGGLTYLWEVIAQPVGDATVYPPVSTQNTSWSFSAYGTYNIRLTVTDGGSQVAVAMRSVALNAPPPTANYTMTPSDGTSPLTVNIVGVDLGTGPITSWSWNFGDGSPVATFNQAAPPSLSHVFAADGTYNVVLTYTGPGGNGTVTKQVGVYPTGQIVVASFTYQFTGNNPGGQIEVCFTNTSTGPIVVNTWDFGDGTGPVVDNNILVCHLYASSNVFLVRLTVADAGLPTPASATDTQTISVVAAPIANFTATPNGTITWGTNVNFTDTSTGAITTWAWDFNGDGIIDSNVQNPTNIPIGNILGTQLGNNTIRLTVTGPGGSSYAEMTINVALLQLTCNITGNFNILPGDPAQNYNSNVGNIGGRTVTYSWTITGNSPFLPVTGSAANLTGIDWATYGFGSFQIDLLATTPDGASCADTQTITRSWLPLNCQMTNNLPSTLYANGTGYTFTANVQNLSGRAVQTYRWYVNGNLQVGQTAATFNWTNTNVDPLVLTPIAVRYEVDVDNGVGYVPPTSTCDETVNFNLNPWPTLACTNIGGPGTPQSSNNATGAAVNSNYTANITGLAGRPVTYTWTAPNGTITTQNPRPNNNGATVQWSNASASFPAAPADDNIAVLVTVTNPDATTVTCNMNRNVAVTVNRLTCNLPTGDVTPVVGETVGYGRSVTNTYNRPWAAVNPLVWELQLWDAINGVWVPQPGGTTNPFNVTFLTAGEQYRIRYSAAVDAANGLPADNCTSGWQTLDVQGVGVAFACDGWGAGNNYSPANPGNYAYNIDIDNGNALPLQYVWTLTGPNGYTHTFPPVTSANDGVFAGPSFTFDSALLAPVGVDDFTLRVDVTDTSLQTPYTCFLQNALAIGTFNVGYTYTGNANAIAVGQSICFTNTSNTSFDGLAGLTYNWNFGTAANTLGTQTTTAAQPGCLSFNTTGVFNVALTGTNPSGSRTNTFTVAFHVYGAQSIAINRTGSNFAGTNQTFNALVTNLTGNLRWRGYDASNNLLWTVNNVAQNASVTRFFTNPGQYTVVADGTGPLGPTSASLQFTLIDINNISASFVPSLYAGQAPMTVCFTDTSTGNNINVWDWDFGNGDIRHYDTGANPRPAQICTTYTTPGGTYPVTLNIQNTSGLTGTATNQIRTYSPLESSATFTINPQNAANFCFTAVLPVGVSVTSWDFGDTNTGPAQNTICHGFASSGTYQVSMHITNGTTTGIITRPVVVNLNNSSPAPSLSVTGNCSAFRVASFTVTNNGGDMVTPDQVTIRDLNGVVVLTDAVLLAANASQTFTVSNLSGAVTFSTVDFGLTANTTCNYPPDLAAAGTCSAYRVASFTITNNGGPMPASDTITILDMNNVVVLTQSFQIAGNASQTFTVNNLSGPVTMQTGTSGITANTTCNYPPDLTAAGTCSAYRAASFTITNAGGPMPDPDTVTILDSSNNVVLTQSFQLAGNASQTFTVNNLSGAVTLQTSTSGVTANTTCNYPPDIAAVGICSADRTATFTVNNVGGPMPDPDTATIRDRNGVVVLTQPFQLTQNGSVVFSVSNISGPVTFTSGTTGITANTTCEYPPNINVYGLCSSMRVLFTINNSDGPMIAPQAYEIRDSVNTLVSTGTFQLARGATPLTVIVSPTAPNETYHFISTGNVGSFNVEFACMEYPSSTDQLPPATPNPSNNTSLIPTVQFPVVDGTTGTVYGDVSPSAPWKPVPGCGYQCVNFQVYHTNRTGDWEIFRLGDYPGQPDANPNLSRGEGAGVDDVAPSRSPNGQWIAFASNRDGNWELYVSRTDGSELHRVTFNTVAIDTDPAWGPNNTLVYETTRDGNWELYLLDLSTGVEMRLTSDDATDINPFWSPDGSKLVFQSDRSGKWQLYELNLGTLETSLLSDGKGEDVDPQYSSTGDRIAFRSTRDGNTNAMIFVMDAKGGAPVAISDAAGDATNHTWSPDDALIAYQSNLDSDLDIYVYDFASGSTRQITDNVIADYAPTWVCGTDELIFTSDITGNPDIFQTSALPIDAPAIKVEEVALQLTNEPAEDVYPQSFPAEENASREGKLPAASMEGIPGIQTDYLHPDLAVTPIDPTNDAGEGIQSINVNGCSALACVDSMLYHTNQTGDWEIFWLGLDGQNPVSQANLSRGIGEGIHDVAPTRSPNGDFVAFVSNRDGNWELYVTSTDGSFVQRATYNEGVDTDPVWSPNGESLVFESNRDGNWELYSLDLASGQVMRLTVDEGSDINPFWSPASGSIVFQSDRSGQWQIYSLNMSTYETTLISDGTGNDYDPVYSTAGDYIAFRSDRLGGKSVLYVMGKNGKNLQAISDAAGNANNAAWYHSDELLAYQSDIDGDMDIYVYEFKTGKTRKVTDNAVADYAPTWACDAPNVVFTSNVLGQPDIFLTPALPINAGSVDVALTTNQLTFGTGDNLYPENTPNEENASRENYLPTR
ncbi:MAG: PD40 domain-containing protein [Chloroflexi bacterium]|nr:PD40 domain-containing protein [Chloroflexota bacterium]